MPNTREKHIDTLMHLGDHIRPHEECELLFDTPLVEAIEYVLDILKNGVTVQEEAKLYWKPVKPGEWNLTCSACDSHLGCREDANFCPECGTKFVYPKAVPPQPPKGEIDDDL